MNMLKKMPVLIFFLSIGIYAAADPLPSGAIGDSVNALILTGKTPVRLYSGAVTNLLAERMGWQNGGSGNTNGWTLSQPASRERNGSVLREQLVQPGKGIWIWEADMPIADADSTADDGESNFSGFHLLLPGGVVPELSGQLAVWSRYGRWAGLRLLGAGELQTVTNGGRIALYAAVSNRNAVALSAAENRFQVERRLNQARMPAADSLPDAKRFFSKLLYTSTNSFSIRPAVVAEFISWQAGGVFPALDGTVDELSTALAAQYWIRSGNYSAARKLIDGLTAHWQQTNLSAESRLNGAALYPVLVADLFLLSGKFSGSLRLVAALLHPLAANRFVSGRIMTGVAQPGVRRLQSLAAAFKKGALLMEIARHRSLRKLWWESGTGLEKYLDSRSGAEVLNMLRKGDGWVWFHGPGSSAVQQTWYRYLVSRYAAQKPEMALWLDLLAVAAIHDTAGALQSVIKLPMPPTVSAAGAVQRAAQLLQWQLLQKKDLPAAAAKVKQTLLLLGRIDRSLRRLMSFRNLQARVDKAAAGDTSLAALLNRISRLRRELDYRTHNPFFRGQLLGLLDDTLLYNQNIFMAKSGIRLKLAVQQPDIGLKQKGRITCSLESSDTNTTQVKFTAQPCDSGVSLTPGDRPGSWELELRPSFYRHGINSSQLPVRVKITATWREYGINFKKTFYRVVRFRSPFEYRLVRTGDQTTGVLVVNRGSEPLHRVGLITNRARSKPAGGVTLQSNQQTVLAVPYSIFTNSSEQLFLSMTPSGGENVVMPVNLPDYAPLSITSNWRWHKDEGKPLAGMTVADGKWPTVSFPDESWPLRDGAYWLRRRVKLPVLLAGTRLEIDTGLLSGLNRRIFWNGQPVKPDKDGKYYVPLDLCLNGGYNRLALFIRNPVQMKQRSLLIRLLPPKFDLHQQGNSTTDDGRSNDD